MHRHHEHRRHSHGEPADEGEDRYRGRKLQSPVRIALGPLAEESLRRYIFDKAFLGANGVDLKFGITTPRIEESAKKRVVAEQSKGIFVLVDSSKFHRVANTRCIALEDTAIISDSNDERIAKRTTLIWQ